MQGVVQPQPGMAVVHLGQHVHEVRPVEFGERHMLIMWCRSSAYRRVACPSTLINRRVELSLWNPQWRRQQRIPRLPEMPHAHHAAI